MHEFSRLIGKKRKIFRLYEMYQKLTGPLSKMEDSMPHSEDVGRHTGPALLPDGESRRDVQLLQLLAALEEEDGG